MQDSTALMCLILTILQELIERVQSFQQAQPSAEIAETLYPLLKKENPMLRIQVLCTATFLCKHGSLEECFEKNTDLTNEDVKALLSSVGCQFTVAKTLRLIEHMLFSTNNCSTLLKNGTLEFLKKTLEEESDSDCKHRIGSLIERLVEKSRQSDKSKIT